MANEIRVLQIDDKKKVLELSKEILEQKDANLSVDTVQTVDGFFNMLEDTNYDCVITDYNKDIDSIKLSEDIDEPVILFTEKSSGDFISEIASSGLTDYVQKRPGLEAYDLLYKRIINYVDLHTCRNRLDEAKSIHDDTVSDLREIYRITSSKSFSFDEKKQRLLEIGVENLGLNTGFLSRIEEDKMIIQNAVSQHDKIKKGEEIPLKDTYCKNTVENENDLLIIEDGESYWNERDDLIPYQQFELDRYIGAKIKVDDSIYGTLCFTSEDDGGRRINERQRAIVEVIARWVSYELENRQYTNELEEANQRLNKFADVMSHDLRNPLTVATSYLEIEKEESQSENIEKVSRSLDRIESIVESCLTISKGTGSPSVEDVKIQEAVDKALFTIGREDMDISREYTTDSVVKADENQFQMLLENILKNASVHGAEPVEIRMGEDSITISDNGTGIDEDGIDDLFKFSANEGSGRGIGLYLVKQVCENHGWRISTYNDNGAVFKISGIETE